MENIHRNINTRIIYEFLGDVDVNVSSFNVVDVREILSNGVAVLTGCHDGVGVILNGVFKSSVCIFVSYDHSEKTSRCVV